MALSMKKSTDNDILSTYANSLSEEAKRRYTVKLLYNRGTCSLPDPYHLTENWSRSPDTWPDLTFGDIYLYLIDTPSLFTKESMKAYKSLDAYKYVLSGHVQEVISHQIDENCPYMTLKTKVTPSQRARDKPHEPWVYLEKASGSVYCAHCTCMAGLGEVCSHVAALLFKVEMAVKMGLTKSSSTSKACQWNCTFRKEVTPATITEIYSQIKGKRTKEIDSVQAHGSAPLPPQNILQELYAIAPNAAFFTSLSGMTSVTDQVEPKYPKLLSTLRQDDIEGNIPDLCEVYQSYSVSASQVSNLEKATRNQSISPLWYQHRMGRITASKAHDVLVRRDSTSPDNLVKRVAGYSVYDLSKNTAVKWGIDTEEECRQAFASHQKGNHLNFKCQLSGFVIDPTHPFLGVSPDGMISCDCCGKGVLEIKCPYKHRDISVEEAAQKDGDFCLDKSLQLKTSHRYFTQVQMQMCITKCQYCDFVVFTKCQPSASMVIVRIFWDEQFCRTLLDKCERFI
ncbi:uncharacterized protein LOC125650107 isoform X2 [Ostrea edulis]|uniref:uncharacterized protein LOC125650107 isoform X2 n=2 Tax=Ostrea edulis TaxID=37623 RepID=UPI0020952C9B|nr:uncharacterized protein LOC125650107 isoform X2 [Ostrea edulis]XP_056021283.1 uncharacterized protein LOC125650107 isoform X2 [Ostrea edulis]